MTATFLIYTVNIDIYCATHAHICFMWKVFIVYKVVTVILVIILFCTFIEFCIFINIIIVKYDIVVLDYYIWVVLLLMLILYC